MIIKRIVFLFILLTTFFVGSAILGLISIRTSSSALNVVIKDTLPGTEALGRLGQELMTAQSHVNALLNPNFSLEERALHHQGYREARESLQIALHDFESNMDKNGHGERVDKVNNEFDDLNEHVVEWIGFADNVLTKFDGWEATKILNSASLLQNLEKYRGDHYKLIRRISEMIIRERAEGEAISPDATLCAFGHWRKNFDSGQDVLSQNPVFQKAMKDMVGPHDSFHANAAKIFSLIKENPELNRKQIQDTYFQLLANADGVIGTFSVMIDEANRAQALYQEASDIIVGEMDEVRGHMVTHLDSLVSYKRDFDNFSNMAIIKSNQRSLWIMNLVSVISIAISIILVVWVVRNIRKTICAIISDLTESANEVERSSSGLSSSSGSMAEGASENAASLEETSAALEELSSMIKRNSDNSIEANSIMAQAREAVHSADQSMSNVIQAMDEISVSGNEINKIIKTIDEIAFQTNLLALNAAVEAARAGEVGAGFAVVADEVRNLAIRSADAAQNTSNLIASTIANIKSGSEMVHMTAESFKIVDGHSNKVASLLSEVAEASKEQSVGISQIARAIQEMDSVTQSNASSAEELASEASQLSSQAAHLLDAVNGMNALVYSGKYGSHTSDKGFKSSDRKLLPMS